MNGANLVKGMQANEDWFIWMVFKAKCSVLFLDRWRSGAGDKVEHAEMLKDPGGKDLCGIIQGWRENQQTETKDINLSRISRAVKKYLEVKYLLAS